MLELLKFAAASWTNFFTTLVFAALLAGVVVSVADNICEAIKGKR